MKKLASILFSTRLTGILFILFGAVMGIATFIESAHGTQTARALVYNAKWFELIMVLFLINFIGNIFKYKLLRKEKWSVLLFHLAFILILIGAGITRYISEEGIMPIEEGKTSNVYLSDKTYLHILVDDREHQMKIADDPLLLSSISKNRFTRTAKFNKNKKSKEESLKLNVPYNKIKVSLVDYIPFKEDDQEYEFIHFVESTDGTRHDHYIQKGESQVIHGVRVGFDNATEVNAINFYYQDEELKIKTPHEGTYLRMRDQVEGVVTKDSLQTFNLLSLHKLAGLSFVVPTPPIEGTYEEITGQEKNQLDTLVLKFEANGKTKEVTVRGRQYLVLRPIFFNFEGLNYTVKYGAKERTLVYGKKPKDKRKKQPSFFIKLRDFQLDKYPGSESPFSYASEITVISPEETFDYRIFMNNILDYKGYRFFQSSYTITEEYEETQLSVNKDYWGTLITYIGYFLLFGAMLVSLFLKNTRFGNLGKQLRKLEAKRKSVVVLFLLSITTFAYGQHSHRGLTEKQLDSMLQTTKVSKEHADKFAKLVIQDYGGRMKPINTYASEFIRKVYKKEEFKGLDANQVFISILQNKRLWFEIPVIYVERKNYQVREILGMKKEDRYAKLSHFFTDKGEYKLRTYQEVAFKKLQKSAFDKDIINIDKRVNLLYATIEGSLFRIFPVQNDPNDTWVSDGELDKANYKSIDSINARRLLPVYKSMLRDAYQSKDYKNADMILDGMIKFQKKFGKAVYPDDRKVELEILYDKYNIFKKLYKWYLLTGALLFILVIFQIFSDRKVLRILVKILIASIVMLFVLHLLGLLTRWYISGHAPWTDAYETMLYVAFSTITFGLIFGRRSTLTIAASAFVAAMFLFFAQQNYFDPAIANLQPVLNSYWILIHVAIIVASYGPFSVAFILGLLSLFLMVFTREKNVKKFSPRVKELTIITEMNITIGLIMLTIGNFLGGMWANESWGRYWGWDPKETWALISIMIYAFVLHMRLIPGLRGRFLFNFASVAAYASIMMTYFGVNFYLAGLHSYGSVGSKPETPNSILYMVLIIFVIALFAYRKYNRHYKS